MSHLDMFWPWWNILLWYHDGMGCDFRDLAMLWWPYHFMRYSDSSSKDGGWVPNLRTLNSLDFDALSALFFRHKHRNWGHRWCHGHCMYWINILHMRSDSYNVLDLKSRSSGKKIQETVIGCSVRRFSREPEHPMNVVSWKLLTNNNPAVSSCYLGGNHHRPLNK